MGARDLVFSANVSTTALL